MDFDGPEKLTAWLKTQGYHARANLRKATGVTRAAISNWCLGHNGPNLKTAYKLQKLTGGAVMASAWPLEHSIHTTAPCKGAEALRAALDARVAALDPRASVTALARSCGVQRAVVSKALYVGLAPKKPEMLKINKALELDLNETDFIQI